mgnify:CR=1 FL=1|jgi:hypothetical protein
MALILTRSPYFISKKNYDPFASLTIEIGVVEFDVSNLSSLRVLDTYTLNFRNRTHLEVSQLIHGVEDNLYTYLSAEGKYFAEQFSIYNLVVKFTIDGTISDVASQEVWTDSALRGYTFASEVQNYNPTEDLSDNGYYAGSSDVLYKLDDSNLEFPLINPTSDSDPYQDLNFDNYCTVTSYLKGEVIDQQNIYFNMSAVNQTFSTDTYASFQERVESDGGELFETKCLTDFFDCHRLVDIDKITIAPSDGSRVKIIEVRTIEEKKYNPYRVSFRNRFGVWEHLWFFKKSVKSIAVDADEYKQNQFKARSAGLLTRSSVEYNKNGTDSITVNSGFVDERMNESFRQLMLSEEVLAYDFNNNLKFSVKVSNSELKMKTSVNDKLINYTIDLEVSNKIIDDIV